MAKLVFEDDKGGQHELAVKNIPTKSLKESDILMVDAEVGTKMDVNAAQAYMLVIRNLFQKYFPKNKVIVSAMREGKKDINLKIVKEKQE